MCVKKNEDGGAILLMADTPSKPRKFNKKRYKNMKKIEFYLISLALMFFVVQIKAQTNSQLPKWALNGKEVDFVNETVNNLSSSLTSPKYVSNSYYDWNNELLFHIIDNNLWWGNGTLAGDLFVDADNYYPDAIFSEMAIVPKNAVVCNEGEYYVIYPLQKMVRDNDKSDNPIITYSIYYNEVDAKNSNLSSENLLIELESGVNNFALLGTAVTDFLPATETRRFYYVYYSASNDASSVKFFNIQDDGIYGPYDVVTINHNNNPNSIRFRPAEVEVSSDLSMIAFTNSKSGSHIQNNNTNDVTIVHLNPATGYLNTSQGTNGFTYIDLGPQNSIFDVYLGLEFDAAMQNLYVTRHNTGLYRYNMSTGVADEISGTSVISNSQLELSRDGYIYGIAADGWLYQIESDGTFLYSGYDVTSSGVITSYKIDNFTPFRTLPEQIDGYNYDDLFSEINSVYCCYLNHESDETIPMSGVVFESNGDIRITGSNVVWNTTTNPFSSTDDIYMRGKLIIEPAAKLTINGLSLYFKEGEQVELSYASSGQRGSQLFLQNSTLTVFDECEPDALWGGIKLTGHNTLPQSPISTTRQPYLYMTNSTVEYADWGVVSGNMMGTDGGGIIIMINSNIKDCVSGVNLNNYSSSNLSYFRQSNFFTTADLYDKGYVPSVHCIMLGVNGVNFMGCNFYNEEVSIPKNEKGLGIFGVLSDFEVKSFCTGIFIPCPAQNIVRGSFSNLETGVISILGNAITINKNDFNDCYGGVWIVANDGVKVTENNFDVYDSHDYSINSYEIFGLYLESSTGYHIEQNLFRDGALGLVVYNSGPYENLIYKNEFNNLRTDIPSTGFIGIGENVGYDLSGWPFGVGLQLRCNSFIDLEFAMSVTGGEINTMQNGLVSVLESDIRQVQGYNLNTMQDVSTYNYFDMGIPVFSDRYFVVDDNYSQIISSSYKYEYHQTNAPGYELPYYYPYHVEVYNYSAENCPSTLGGGFIIIPIIINSIDSLDNEIHDLENEYLSLTSGYNETELELLAQTASSFSSSTAFNSLSNASPYLTAEILIAYLHNTQVSEFARASIMIENSPLPSKVLDELPKSDLSSQLISHILQLQIGVNPLEEIQNSIQQHKGAKQFITDRLVRETFSSDTSANNDNTYSQVLAFLSNQNDVYSKKRLVDLLIRKSEFQQAISVLEDIRQYSLLTNNCRMAEYVKLQTIKIDILNNFSEKPILEIVEKYQLELEGIASDYNTKEGGVARSILASAGLFDLQPIIILPQASSKKSYSPPPMFNNEINSDKLEPLFRIYPNPTDYELFVEFISPSVGSTFNIYTANGKLIKSVKSERQVGFLNINVSDLKTGNYIIESPQLQSSQRFVITR